MFNFKNLVISTLVLSAFLIAFSGSHPTSATGGYTAAPGDGICSQCHTSNNTSLDGEFLVTGIPEIIEANTTYTVDIQLTNPSGNASRGGFQILALDEQNTQGGSWANESAGASLKTSSGKTYLGHQGSQSFPASNELNWSGEWTSPDEENATFNFYAVSIIANGGNGNQNDRFLLQQFDATIEAASTPLTADVTLISNETCQDAIDGSAMVNISGGTPPYLIVWDNGETTETATMLPSGNSSVTVTDDNNLFAEAEIDILPGNAVSIDIVDFTEANCFGNEDGSITVEAIGGVEPYLYEWSNGTAGATISNIASGNYTVTATDANDCFIEQTIFLDQPDEISVTSTLIEPFCVGDENGIIILSVSGGTGPYMYLWEDGSQNSDNFNLLAGTYLTTITDQNGCSIEISNTLEDPPPFDASQANVVNPICSENNSGSIELLVAGSSPDYIYNWSNGESTATISNLSEGTYTVTVTSNDSCVDTVEFVLTNQINMAVTATSTPESTSGASDGTAVVSNIVDGEFPFSYEWSNGDTTEMITELESGIYNVTVTDVNGCTAEALTVVIAGDCALEAIVDLEQVSCAGENDGKATITLIGANEPVTYQWSDGASIGNRMDLVPDTFELIVIDAAGCSDTVSNLIIMEPDSLNLDIEILNNPLCVNDSTGILNVSVSGGSMDYSYLWSNMDTTATSDSIIEGVYSVTVTDINGCIDSLEINVVSNDSIAPNIILNDLIYYIPEDGNIDVPAAAFDNGSTDNCGDISFEYITTPILDCTMVGMEQNVLISATDSSNNTDTLEATLALVDTIGPTLEMMFDSIIQLGCEPTFYDIPLPTDNCSDSVSITQVQGLASGEVFPVGESEQVFEYRDASNNISTFTLTIQILSDLEAEIDVMDNSCFSDTTGMIMVTLNGSNEPYLQDSSLIMSGLVAGNYTITANDTSGCMYSEDITINQPEQLVGNTTAEGASGSDIADGVITFMIEGGTSPYSIQLFDLQGNLIEASANGAFNNLLPGIYNAIVNDDNGCELLIEEIEVGDLTNNIDLFTDYGIESYPNPISEILTIEVAKNNGSLLNFEIVSIDGQLVQSGKLNNTNAIDMSEFTSGLYLLRITDRKSTTTKKLLLQKQ